MKWQEKLERYLNEENLNTHRLAGLLKIKDSTLRYGLRKDWTQVRYAVKLAKKMGCSMDYLFNPATDWPPPKRKGHRTDFDERRVALELLAEHGQIDALERVAAGIPPGSPIPAKKKGKSNHSRR